MDLNIGAALWLAASATGTLVQAASGDDAQADVKRGGRACSLAPQQLHEVPTPTMSRATCYVSSARVLLLGHGADEQCAGYGRHRTR